MGTGLRRCDRIFDVSIGPPLPIVTGNKRNFPDASYGATRGVNAGELLDRITFEI
jgi:hypothetical protein